MLFRVLLNSYRPFGWCLSIHPMTASRCGLNSTTSNTLHLCFTAQFANFRKVLARVLPHGIWPTHTFYRFVCHPLLWWIYVPRLGGLGHQNLLQVFYFREAAFAASCAQGW